MIVETFIHGKGFLYKIDPRPKFLLLNIITIIMLFEKNYFLHLVIYFFLFILSIRAFGLKIAIVPIKSIYPILVLTTLLTPLFDNYGEIVLSFGNKIFITDHGIRQTILLLFRFTIVTTLFFVFFSTTKTSDFILTLRAFGLPFQASLAITISLRYIPDMFYTYHRISDAHRLRIASTGVEKKKNFHLRISRIFPVLTSVLIYAVKSIPDLAMALDSKGFERQNKRTCCKKLALWKTIVFQMFIAFILAVLLILLSCLF